MVFAAYTSPLPNHRSQASAPLRASTYPLGDSSNALLRGTPANRQRAVKGSRAGRRRLAPLRLEGDYAAAVGDCCVKQPVSTNCSHRTFLTLPRFLTFRFGDKLGDLNAITPDDIVAFLCKLKAGSTARRCKAAPSHLRSLFTFLFWSGKTRRNPAQSLPRIATGADHLPRHSLTTDMLRKGASLDEAGDVLRHRSRMTTTIYAKYDLDALRSIARRWPAGGDAR